MLYIPMFKGRQYEQQTIRKANNFFDDKIVPLIEIVQDHHKKTDFEVNSVTGEFIKERHGSRETRKRKYPTDEDIDTLSFYSECVNNKRVFIDYFRFSTDVYGRNIDTSKIPLSVRLNQDEKLYSDCLNNISGYDNLIPVLSIKKDYYPRNFKPVDMVKKLQLGNKEIAARLDEIAFGDYAKTLAPTLRETDYLMYDIGEQNSASKKFELSEFDNLDTRAKKIVLNSPRKRATQNSLYINNAFTDLIENSARDLDEQYGNIVGFGDYCGLRDTLPINGPIIFGAALALIYLYDKNQFKAFMNPDTSESMRGFYKLIPQIIANSRLLDPQKTCPVMKEIVQMERDGSCGGWGGWIRLICMRYLHQMYTNI